MPAVGGMDRGDGGEGGKVFLDDTVFIQGLPETVTEERLAEHFADAGAMKVSLQFCAFIQCLLVVSTGTIACKIDFAAEAPVSYVSLVAIDL